MKVAVIVTAYEREKYLPDAFFSLAVQTDKPDEVVLVKTPGRASTDPYYRERATRIIEVPVGTTAGEAYLAGLDATTADVVSFLDDDDTFAPEKVAQVRATFSDPDLIDLNIVGYRHRYVAVGEDLATPVPGWDRTHPIYSGHRIVGFEANARSDYAWLVRHSYLNNSTYSLRREVLERVRGILPKLNAFHDAFFLLSAVSAGNVLFSPEPLSYYRFHTNVTHSSDGRATGSDLERWMSFVPYLERIGLSPLARYLRDDMAATNPIALAHSGGRKPTATEWRAYRRIVLRRHQPYLVRDGLRAYWRSRGKG